MAGHDIIVIGTSAGGVEALSRLVRDLPADLPAALFVVLHLPSYGVSALPRILSRLGPLPAFQPEDGEEIRHGRIYLAPPDHHLLVQRGIVRVVRGPRENGHRPAADPLFRSAARAYGRRVVGVVLSGVLDDGTAGLAVVKIRGGVTIVQDPEDALYPDMPRNALENVAVDDRLSLSALPARLVQLAHEPAQDEKGVHPVSDSLEQEIKTSELDAAALHSDERPGTPSGFACPDCGGTLFELYDGDLFRFRCRVGHAWSADSLVAEQIDGLEAALWTALRALEENAALSRRMAARAHERGQNRSAERFERLVQDAEEHAELIRRVLLKGTLAKAVGAERNVSLSGADNGNPPHAKRGSNSALQAGANP